MASLSIKEQPHNKATTQIGLATVLWGREVGGERERNQAGGVSSYQENF